MRDQIVGRVQHIAAVRVEHEGAYGGTIVSRASISFVQLIHDGLLTVCGSILSPVLDHLELGHGLVGDGQRT